MPTNVFSEILQQVEDENISEEFRKLLAEKADRLFEQQKATEDSRYLSRISRYIVSAWDLLKIFAQRKEGEVIVVDFDGNIYRGRLSEERLGKFRKLPHKVPQYIPSNWDDAAITYKKFVSKSVAEPMNIVSGLSHEWDSAIKKAAKTQQLPLLDMFIRIIRKLPDVQIHHEIVKSSAGHIEDTFWCDNFDVKFTVNERGTVLRYESHGKITKIQ